MIAKAFTQFLGVQPFAIMGFTGNDGAGMGRGLLVWAAGLGWTFSGGREPGGGARAARGGCGAGRLTHETATRDISADSG
jgi:hypothetical protein